LSPMYKITSLSDAGEKYGGTDFPSYKLQISCEFEIDLPTYLHIKADWKLNSANINLQMGGVHTLYGKQPPSNTLNEARKEPDPEYKGITNMTVYEIPLEQLDDSTTLIEVTDVWPSNTDIIDWNAVTSGRLIMINNESDWDLVGPDDIIYCQTFNESHITEQRIANGFITIDPANTDYIKSKAGLLNKPVFSGLSITDISILLSFNGNIITLDSYRNKIYLGKFIAIKLRKTEDGWGSDNVRGLSITNPEDIDNIKNKFTNQSPTIQTIFSTLDIHNSIDFDIHDVVYYEFSDSDIELKSDEHVVIPYTHDIVDKDQIKMISYIGELEYEKHYNLDLANKTITLKFPAKEHEGVEIYFYKIIS